MHCKVQWYQIKTILNSDVKALYIISYSDPIHHGSKYIIDEPAYPSHLFTANPIYIALIYIP